MNKLFCKLVSSISSITVCASAFALPVLSAEPAGDAFEIVFSESFNAYATNAEPDSLDINGGGCFVEEHKSGDKALVMDMSTGAKEISFGANFSEEFFFSFDISSTERITGSLTGQCESGNIDILQIKKGKLCTHNGMDVCGLGENITNVTVAMNPASSTYDIYINGECKYADYYLKGFKDATVNGIVFLLSTENGGTLALDNINVAIGTPKKLSSRKINTVYPTDEYNPEVVEKYDPATLVSDYVFMNQDFSTPKFDALYHGKDNLLERTTDDEGNAWCQFERTGTQDFHLDISIASYPSSSIVYEYDIMSETNDIRVNSTFKSSEADYFSMNTVEGGAVVAGGKTHPIETGKWHTVSTVYNVSNAKYSVYVDYEPLVQNLDAPFDYKEKEADIWRFHVNRSSGGDKFRLDNIKIYGGTEPRKDVGNVDVVVDDKSTIFEKDSTQRNILKNRVSYHLRSGVLYNGEEKQIIAPLVENGVTYVPVSFFEAAFGSVVSYDKASLTAKVDTMEFVSGQKSFKKDAQALTLANAPKELGGTLYLPLREIVTGAMGKKLYYDNTTYSSGMIIMSDKDISISKGVDMQKLNDFALLYRPDREEIIKLYKESSLYGKHPRVMADASDFDRVRTLWQTDAQMRSWINSVIGSADSLCEDPTPLVYELRDGVRLLYVSRDLCAHMRTLGIAYQMTGDKKYAERAWVDMEAVSNFHTWHPEHDIDVGEMAAGFAIGYDWMYDAYTPEQRKIMEEGARANGIMEYVDTYQNRGGHLAVNGSNNHTTICNAGGGMLGIAMLDAYPESASYIIASSVRGLEHSIAGYIPDGDWFEGIGYAGLNLELMSQHFASLEKVFGTCFGVTNVEGVDKIAYYFLNMQSKMGSFGFGDGSGGGVTSEPGCLWLCNHFDDAPAATTYKEIVGLTGDWRTILWYRPEMLNSKDLVPLDALYVNQDVFVTRDTWVKAEQNTFAGIKGGAANHGHAHGDIGKFDFYANGVKWTTESGGYDYNAPDYWNWHGGVDNGPAGKRWQYWGTRGEAHNTLIIDPDSQFEFDPFERAVMYHTESKPRGSIALINTTPVHRGKALKAERGMMMADERRSLVVRDEVTVAKPCKVYWHMFTTQDAKLSEDGKRVIIAESGNPQNYVTVDFLCDAPYTLTVARPELLPNSPNNEYVTVDTHTYQIRVCIDAKDAVNLTAKITPMTVENGTDISEFNIPMSQWTIPDGEIPELPRLDTLTVDGIEYNPNLRVINHFVSQSKTDVPEIVAESDKYNVDIDLAKTLSDVTTIVVSDKADSSNKSTYKISFTPLKSTGVGGIEECDIISVTASEEPQAENPVKSVLDRDLSTRWSAENAQHIVVDLGKEVEFDTIVMAFMDGNGRYYNLKMSVSSDNDSYKEVFSGTSGGKSNDYELFDIGKQKARYVKIEGSGHKEGTWNSWTEIAVARKK